MGDFSERVFTVVDQIPKGKVSTYGQIARMIGSPRSARYVGYALRGNPNPGVSPCHRVVFKDGGICEGYAFGGPEVQRKLLMDEGITFIDAMHIDIEACLWDPGESTRTRPEDIDWAKEMGDGGL